MGLAVLYSRKQMDCSEQYLPFKLIALKQMVELKILENQRQDCYMEEVWPYFKQTLLEAFEFLSVAFKYCSLTKCVYVKEWINGEGFFDTHAWIDRHTQMQKRRDL